MANMDCVDGAACEQFFAIVFRGDDGQRDWHGLVPPLIEAMRNRGRVDVDWLLEHMCSLAAFLGDLHLLNRVKLIIDRRRRAVELRAKMERLRMELNDLNAEAANLKTSCRCEFGKFVPCCPICFNINE